MWGRRAGRRGVEESCGSPRAPDPPECPARRGLAAVPRPDRRQQVARDGILTAWPECGPPLVWHRELGEGYGIGSVSEGKFYQLERVADQRVCVPREPHRKLLWKFEYRSDFEDMLATTTARAARR